MGTLDGEKVGECDGTCDGASVGSLDGEKVGVRDGACDGTYVGETVGAAVVVSEVGSEEDPVPAGVEVAPDVGGLVIPEFGSADVLTTRAITRSSITARDWT